RRLWKNMITLLDYVYAICLPLHRETTPARRLLGAAAVLFFLVLASSVLSCRAGGGSGQLSSIEAIALQRVCEALQFNQAVTPWNCSDAANACLAGTWIGIYCVGSTITELYGFLTLFV